MNWKFWKKGDDFSMPDYSSSQGNELGLGQDYNHSGLAPGQGGLDMGSHFEPPALSPLGASMAPSMNTPVGQAPGMNLGRGFGDSPGPNFTPVDERGAQGSANSKDFELIVAKLDAIRSQLETLNMRVANIEQKTNNPNQVNESGVKKPWY